MQLKNYLSCLPWCLLIKLKSFFVEMNPGKKNRISKNLIIWHFVNISDHDQKNMELNQLHLEKIRQILIFLLRNISHLNFVPLQKNTVGWEKLPGEGLRLFISFFSFNDGFIKLSLEMLQKLHFISGNEQEEFAEI